MSRARKKASVSHSDHALDLKAEVERSTARSDGTFTFSVVAGAIGLGIELLENEKAHAAETADQQTNGTGDPVSAESAVRAAHEAQTAVSHMDAGTQQAMGAGAVQVLAAAAQPQVHAMGVASPATVSPAGAKDHPAAAVSDESGPAHHPASASADEVPTGTDQSASVAIGSATDLVGESEGGGLPNAAPALDHITGGSGGPLPNGVVSLTDDFGLSAGFDPVTDLLSGVTDTLGGTLHDVLNVSTALTPVADLASGALDLASNLLSTAGDLLGGGQDGGLLPDVISTLTGGGTDDGSNVVSDLLQDVAGTVGGALPEMQNVSTVLTPVTDLLSGVGDNGFVSNVVSAATALLGREQDTGAALDTHGVAADTGPTGHGGIVSGLLATATAALTGSSEPTGTEATATPQPDAPAAMPGVGDVLDLSSSLVGVIVPVLGYVGQPEFEASEHHDLGSSHGSLLHMLV